ncbi:hypothetical protein TJ43_03200, partial [Salmonella enterica subsp. enterica serovar Thompson]
CEETARRASAASQSPLTAIFKKEFVRKYGLFFALNPRRLPDDGAIYKRLIRLPRAQRHQANY